MNSKQPIIDKAYIVPGLPHILLAADKSTKWQALRRAYDEVQKEIATSDADLILYYSTQWLSVLGYMFQGDPAPRGSHVDENWHEYGTMPYEFKVDTGLARACTSELAHLGYTSKLVNYEGFPIDTGTIVAQKLLNPTNKFPAAMVSCNIYAGKSETIALGKACARALASQKKKAILVLVSSLSHRFEVKEIIPESDQISSQKDDEWNRKIIELFSMGALDDVAHLARDFGAQANADMSFKGIWWLSGLCGKRNDFEGKVYDYQPVWGTGAALVGLSDKTPLVYDPRYHGDISKKDDGSLALKAVLEKPSTKQNIMSAKAPEPVGPYPHARQEGNLLFISGMGPRKPHSKSIPGVSLDDTGTIVSYDIAAQTTSVFENLKVILEDAGSSLDRIVDVQVFLTDIRNDFAKFNEVYARYFNAENGPTRTTVEVNRLPTLIAIELKVIAKI